MAGAMPLKSYVGQFDERALVWARLVHRRVFGPLRLKWSRRGTWIEAWDGPRRVAFAPHRQAASIYFQGPAPVEEYRQLGGVCDTGKVCIRVPIGADFDDDLLSFLVAKYLELS